MQNKIHTDVLIVGAGPAGLSLATELGNRGINCIIIERNNRVGNAPRAKTSNVRTMEHFRRWGIADNLRKASKLPADYPSDIIFSTRLNGHFLAKIENAFNCSSVKNNHYSEHAQWIPQYEVETVLKDNVETLPSVKLLFKCSLLEATQDENNVFAKIKDETTDSEFEVVSKYLVGADGARSIIREIIGAKMTGKHGFSKNFNVQFKAPELAKLIKFGPAIMYWQINNEVPSLIGPMEGNDLWYFIATGINGEKEDLDPVELIKKATNFDFDIEVVGTSPWLAHSLIANKYSEGRMLLIGDACHLHPPFGGYGMNMGIGDGVDLGWKLAAVLNNWGGEKLIESYEIERRPIHQKVIEESVANYNAVGNQLFKAGLESDGIEGESTRNQVATNILTTKIREFWSLGVVLGNNLDESPIVVPDGSLAPVWNSMNYQPSAHPGCLAPHLWLRDGSSLYDHFGDSYTLLITEGNNASTKYDEILNEKNIPLKVIAPNDDRLSAIYQAQYVLVRPDQHVAWRSDLIPENFEEIFNLVRGGIEYETV